MVGLSFIPSALLASQGASLFPFSPSTLSNLISPRDSLPSLPAEAVPKECRFDCQGLVNLGKTCPVVTVECVCSEAVGFAFVQCGNCLAKQPGVAEEQISNSQTNLDALTSTCQSRGHPMRKPLKISTPPNSGTLSLSPSSTIAILSAVGGLLVVAL